MSDDDLKSHFAEKYFDEIDEISEDENYFTPVLRDTAREIDFKTAHVLDVGCGTGLFLKPVIDAGCTECVGIDGPSAFAPRAIARGYKDVRFVADLNNTMFPFGDGKFDLVVCKDVFEHLLNPTFALSEIKRVLKPGGLLLLHVPNHFPLYGRLKFLLTNDIDTFSFFKDESRWTFPHIRFYEHDDSLSVFKDQGFALIRDLSCHFPAVPLLSRFGILKPLLRRVAARFPNQFAAGFTFLLKKK